MAPSRRQKAFVAVFFLGLTALVGDRVFVRPQGGPARASADPAGKHAVSASPAKGPSSPSPETQGPTVAERLDRLWADTESDQADTRDPFALSGSWLASPAKETAAAPNPSAEFAKTHPLVAVVMDGRQSYALINDRILTLGEAIDGFTLVAVGARSAVFERQGERVTLELVNK